MNPESPQQNVPLTPQPQFTQEPTPVTTPIVQNGSKKMAVTALVLSIVGFVTGFLFIGFVLAIAAMILSIIGLVKNKPGKGMNIASIIISGLCLVLAPVVFTFWTVAYNGVSERANQAAMEAESTN